MTSRKYYDMELQKLNGALLEMGEMIRMAISGAVAALLEHDHDRARSIIAYDEEIDKQNRQIEQQCYSLLLSQQPVAGDLRMVSAALKMTTDMERIGDHAADISELTIAIANVPCRLPGENIKKMAAETMVMLVDAVDSYVNKDVEKAHAVIVHDDIVDDYFVKVKADLIEVIRRNPEYGEYAADLLLVNKYLERIGDLAVDILNSFRQQRFQRLLRVRLTGGRGAERPGHHLHLAQDHIRVVDEVAVHLDAVLVGGKVYPFGFYIHHSFPLLEEQNV